MRLADFISSNLEPILVEWENFARTLDPGADLTVLELRDDAGTILRSVARDMKQHQSPEQQASKSVGAAGAGGDASDALDEGSTLHGEERAGQGFHITDVVAEYRAVRASVLRLWTRHLPNWNQDDLDDIIRFNEALDQSLRNAVESYSERVERSRRMFLGILSHDLRNPLACIRIATHLLSRKEGHAPAVDEVSMIDASTETMQHLITDLTDYALSGLGQEMPLNREPIDLTLLCREVVASYRTTHPGRTLRLHADPAITGVWDAARMRQLVSNLVGNALDHGSTDGPVDLSVLMEESPQHNAAAVLTVHNEGPPIPPKALSTIFDPLKSHVTRDAAARRNQHNIGLGLYIVREIVLAKGGTVEVNSTAEEGTTFTVRIPRVPTPSADTHPEAHSAR